MADTDMTPAPAAYAVSTTLATSSAFTQARALDQVQQLPAHHRMGVIAAAAILEQSPVVDGDFYGPALTMTWVRILEEMRRTPADQQETTLFQIVTLDIDESFRSAVITAVQAVRSSLQASAAV